MSIAAANREALSRLCRARPKWTGVQLARDVLGLTGHMLLRERVLRFVSRDNDQFFLTWGMCAAKAAARAIEGIAGSTVVSAMARNGVEFGIRVAGLGDRWFTGPASRVVGSYFPARGET